MLEGNPTSSQLPTRMGGARRRPGAGRRAGIAGLGIVAIAGIAVCSALTASTIDRRSPVPAPRPAAALPATELTAEQAAWIAAVDYWEAYTREVWAPDHRVPWREDFRWEGIDRTATAAFLLNGAAFDGGEVTQVWVWSSKATRTDAEVRVSATTAGFTIHSMFGERLVAQPRMALSATVVLEDTRDGWVLVDVREEGRGAPLDPLPGPRGS